jgi:glycosyltransferase involved in cell wall biosynthesis
MGNIGLITDEMINLAGSRTGGFGWATRTLHHELASHPELGGHPVVITRNDAVRRANGGLGRVGPDSSRRDLLTLRPALDRDPVGLARLLRYRFAAFVTIDYRPSYGSLLRTFRRTPLVLWSRDPRGPEEQAQIETLREPGYPDLRPRGIERIRTERLPEALAGREPGSGFQLAVVTPFLEERLAGAYGIAPGTVTHLPNILPPVEVRSEDRAARPTVVMMGRLDAIKRPWLAVELARRLPHVDFVLAGKRHANARWEPTDVPDNVEVAGEVFGERKDRLYRRAWLLLNTSIHEGLPVTFQEALAYRVPVVSYLDPEQVPSRFGYAAGPEPGDGLAGLDRLEHGVNFLVEDQQQREERGARGQQWVRATHNRQRFHEAWTELARAWTHAPGAPVGS